MNNQDHGRLAFLLHTADVRVELISSMYSGDYDIPEFQYTIFSDDIQEALTGVRFPSYNYDKDIHQFEFPDYVGTGYTLKEAWDDFADKIDTLYYMTERDKILLEITNGSQKA